MDAGSFDAPVSDTSAADAANDGGMDHADDGRLEFTESGDRYDESVSDTDIGGRLDQSYSNAVGSSPGQPAPSGPSAQPGPQYAGRQASSPAGGYPASAPMQGQGMQGMNPGMGQGWQAYGQQPMQQPQRYDAAPMQNGNVQGSAPGYGYGQPPAGSPPAGGPGYDDRPETPPADDHDDGKRRKGRRAKRDKGGYDRKKKSKIKSNDASLSASHARAWRWTFIIGLLIIVLLAVKEAVFPAPSITQAQVQQMIYQQTGTTKFPLDRGSAIAKAFIASYIPISGDPAAASMLDNFYSGTRFKTESDVSVTNSSQAAPSSSGEVTQVIQSGPYVYKQRAVSDSTANYVIGTLVYRKQHGQPVMSADGKTPEYKWLYFNVGIYWDEKTDKLAIDTNSPTVTSAPEMRASASLPTTQLPGDGKLDQDATDQATDSITNFMKAWGQGDKSSLKTLTAPDKTAAAMNGLNGTLTIKDMSTMKISVYGHPLTDNMYRALVEMKWNDVVSTTDGQNNGVEYGSRYILKMEKTSEGKFLVQDINPYYYVPDKGTSR